MGNEIYSLKNKLLLDRGLFPMSPGIHALAGSPPIACVVTEGSVSIALTGEVIAMVLGYR